MHSAVRGVDCCLDKERDSELTAPWWRAPTDAFCYEWQQRSFLLVYAGNSTAKTTAYNNTNKQTIA